MIQVYPIVKEAWGDGPGLWIPHMELEEVSKGNLGYNLNLSVYRELMVWETTKKSYNLNDLLPIT